MFESEAKISLILQGTEGRTHMFKHAGDLQEEKASSLFYSAYMDTQVTSFFLTYCTGWNLY